MKVMNQCCLFAAISAAAAELSAGLSAAVVVDSSDPKTAQLLAESMLHIHHQCIDWYHNSQPT
jgi:hypothetical protein